jgi:cytoskeletal protein RodZ
MVFVAGALAGGVVGLGAGVILQRRAGRAGVIERRGFATALAMVALVVAAVALANSDRRGAHTGDAAAVSSATTATTTSTPATATTSTSTTPTGLISVPNVEHLSRSDAVPILERAGLKVSIESLPLADVPAGFVISQSPLPGAMAPAGATVALVVSAAA